MQVYFAPLESITGYVFRNVFEKYYGGIDRYFTPFITATDSKRLRNKEMRDILPENNQVGCLIPQIMSNRAEELLRVAGQMAELGYDTVNLNLGCPARTVVSKGKGSGFLARTVALDRFLEEIYRECPLKISIKTRLGVDDPEEFPEIIDIYNQYPVEELMPAAERLAQTIAKNAPIAVRACKKAINEGLQTDMDRAVEIEEALFGSCFETEDQQEGMHAFLEKRKHEPYCNR